MISRTQSLHLSPEWILGIILPLLMVPDTIQADPVIVKNIEPAQRPSTVALEEMWRVGGEDEEFLFGMVVDCMTDAEGNVYLLDNQLCNVEVFTAAGEHLRTLSRQGDGPGEIRIPQGLVMMPDGTLGILELFPGKIVKLTLAGEPQGNLTLGGNGDPQTGFVAAIGSENRGGTMIVAAQHSIPSDAGQDRTQYLARISEEGEELVRYREASMILDFNNPRFVERELLPAFLLASSVGPDGHVYVARDRDQYAIEVYSPDGSLVRVIEREFKNWKRDNRDLRRMNALVDAWIQGFPGEMPRDLETYEPAITELFVTDEGTLWVQHSRSGRDLPEGILLSYDTFDAEGKYLQEVHIASEGDPAFDGLRFLSGDRALLIKGYVLARWASRGAQNATFDEEEEASPMEIVYCRKVP
jgi:hypothetical protein